MQKPVRPLHMLSMGVNAKLVDQKKILEHTAVVNQKKNEINQKEIQSSVQQKLFICRVYIFFQVCLET